jgi:two-component system NarL family sensor kinase
MRERDHQQRSRRLGASLGRDWEEIGGLGRIALIGLGLALVVTIVLGFSITRAARGHLLDARASMVEVAIRELPAIAADGSSSAADLARLDAHVRIHILGGETLRVKVWAPDGTVLYSDLPELIGQRFDVTQPALTAFAGGTGTLISDLSDPAHAVDRDRGELIELYVPILDESGSVVSVVEVEQDVTALNRALGRIGRNVWLSIGIGLFVLGIFMTALLIARGRELNRRRRQVEELLRSSYRAQEVERRRIVGALHDDVGQPLYRVLYGLEGSRARLADDDPVVEELGRLEDIVKGMDDTLRNELRILQVELAADTGLDVALADLVDVTRREADLDLTFTIDVTHPPSPEQSVELYRAAREALTNVRKHARASRVAMTVYEVQGRVVLDVADNGVGSAGDSGLGLSTTRQRFETLGGDVDVSAPSGGGTLFRAWLPFTGQEST